MLRLAPVFTVLLVFKDSEATAGVGVAWGGATTGEKWEGKLKEMPDWSVELSSGNGFCERKLLDHK